MNKLLVVVLFLSTIGCARSPADVESIFARHRASPDSAGAYDDLVALGPAAKGALQDKLLNSKLDEDHFLALLVLEAMRLDENIPVFVKYVKQSHDRPFGPSVCTALNVIGRSANKAAARKALLELANPPTKWNRREQSAYRKAWNSGMQDAGGKILQDIAVRAE